METLRRHDLKPPESAVKPQEPTQAIDTDCPLRAAAARPIADTERRGARSADMARSCVPDRRNVAGLPHVGVPKRRCRGFEHDRWPTREHEHMPDDDLPKIGAPATRALASIGVTQLTEVADRSESELLRLHGFGPRALRILKEALAANGLSMRP